MQQFKIEVEAVHGHCSCGYRVGDRFAAEGLATPRPPLCGGAYLILFPMQTALACGARFSFEKDPLCKTRLACPDEGKVVFRITLLDARDAQAE